MKYIKNKKKTLKDLGGDERGIFSPLFAASCSNVGFWLPGKMYTLCFGWNKPTRRCMRAEPTREEGGR